MEVWKTEDPSVNFEKRFAHYEIYTWTVCRSYLHEKQTSRIQSLSEWQCTPHLRSPYFQIIPYFFRIWNLEKMRTKYGNKEMQKKIRKISGKIMEIIRSMRVNNFLSGISKYTKDLDNILSGKNAEISFVDLENFIEI